MKNPYLKQRESIDRFAWIRADRMRKSQFDCDVKVWGLTLVRLERKY